MDWFLWIKAVHVLAVISWMAGMLYLPRLFVYHADSAPGSNLSETFKVMERRLLRAIINPAMILSWLMGLLLAFGLGVFAEGWFLIKFAGVIGLSVVHMYLARIRRRFEIDERPHSARFFRFLNEVPTVLMIVIVIMVVVKPF